MLNIGNLKTFSLICIINFFRLIYTRGKKHVPKGNLQKMSKADMGTYFLLMTNIL